MAAEQRKIVKFQVDLECDEKCEMCERFFKCNSPKKLEIFDRRRMSKVRETMKRIKHKIAICAGKGGVGKSTLSVNIATALAMKGQKVTILDQDLDGSCIPRMMGVLDKKLIMEKKGMRPVEGILGIQVVALANIQEEKDTTTWYHELRRNATEEFLAHVQYGDRDYLIIDLPPGTSSDAVNLMQYIPDLDGMVVVTVPSGVSQTVARRAGLMAMEGGVKVVGIIENMSGYMCSNCKKINYPMLVGGGEELAKELEVPFLGRIPLDPRVSSSTDTGAPYVYEYPESPIAKAIFSVVENIEKSVFREAG